MTAEPKVQGFAFDYDALIFVRVGVVGCACGLRRRLRRDEKFTFVSLF